MSQPQRDDRQRRYTWTDYQTWPDDQRWEIIGGEPFAMSPSPTSRHQRICGRLSAELHTHFKGKRCEIFISPLDVKLSDEDIVQPDLLVVCDPNQVRRTHIEGAPTLAVEILSPSSIAHDRLRKMNLYARVGVKELWIVTPFPPLVEVFVLDGTTYRWHSGFERDAELISPTFPESRVDLAPVFDFPPEPDDPRPIVREVPAQYASL